MQSKTGFDIFGADTSAVRTEKIFLARAPHRQKMGHQRFEKAAPHRNGAHKENFENVEPWSKMLHRKRIQILYWRVNKILNLAVRVICSKNNFSTACIYTNTNESKGFKQHNCVLEKSKFCGGSQSTEHADQNFHPLHLRNEF
jgi:hypothetical protein